MDQVKIDANKLIYYEDFRNKPRSVAAFAQEWAKTPPEFGEFRVSFRKFQRVSECFGGFMQQLSERQSRQANNEATTEHFGMFLEDFWSFGVYRFFHQTLKPPRSPPTAQSHVFGFLLLISFLFLCLYRPFVGDFRNTATTGLPLRVTLL